MTNTASMESERYCGNHDQYLSRVYNRAHQLGPISADAAQHSNLTPGGPPTSRPVLIAEVVLDRTKS
jgi:hypothetical protein